MAIFTILILPNHKHGMFFHLCPLLFPWAVVCSSPWTGPLHPLLVVFLGILFSLWQLWMRVCSWFGSLLVCYWCIGMLVISAHWFLYPETLLKLLISFRRLWAEMMDLLNIQSCCLQIETILLPPFLIEYPLFISLAWLLWLELPILYWIWVVREGILV